MHRVILKATEGMLLTNGEIYGRTVFLGTGDSPDNWWEVTEAQALHNMEQEEKEYEEDIY